MTTERLTFEVDIVRGGDARVVSVNGEVLPEFLPVSPWEFLRVANVGHVELGDATLHLTDSVEGFQATVLAPYFSAWLDRLGIPWTHDLRKAHEAATNALCHDAPGGGLLCVRPRGHAGPHGCRLHGVDRDWLPPMHPDARAKGDA